MNNVLELIVVVVQWNTPIYQKNLKPELVVTHRK